MEAILPYVDFQALDPNVRAIAQGLSEGYTQREISQELGVPDLKVYALTHQLRTELIKQALADPDLPMSLRRELEQRREVAEFGDED